MKWKLNNATDEEIEQIKKIVGDKLVRGISEPDNREPEKTDSEQGIADNSEQLGKQDNNPDRIQTQELEIESVKPEQPKKTVELEQVKCANCNSVFDLEPNEEIPKKCPKCETEW